MPFDLIETSVLVTVSAADLKERRMPKMTHQKEAILFPNSATVLLQKLEESTLWLKEGLKKELLMSF